MIFFILYCILVTFFVIVFFFRKEIFTFVKNKYNKRHKNKVEINNNGTVNSQTKSSNKHKNNKNKVETNNNVTTNSQNKYVKKKIMTDCEKYFFNILNKYYKDKYIIVPQVNLSSIVNKIKDFPKQYQSELFRIIDFGIFDKNTMDILLLIEINDKTHNRPDRIKRDIKVKEICRLASINLITFYTNYSNKENYVINRINFELKKC